jgi:hypothetical protein
VISNPSDVIDEKYIDLIMEVEMKDTAAIEFACFMDLPKLMSYALKADVHPCFGDKQLARNMRLSSGIKAACNGNHLDMFKTLLTKTDGKIKFTNDKYNWHVDNVVHKFLNNGNNAINLLFYGYQQVNICRHTR